MYKFFATAICIALLAQPIGAAAASPNSSAEDQVPVVFDAFLMRPLGFGAIRRLHSRRCNASLRPGMAPQRDAQAL